MSKKLLLFISISFIISIILVFLSFSFKNNKVESLNVAKSNEKSNHLAIKSLSDEELDNRGLLNKIEKNPDDVASKANDRVEKFVSELKEGNSMNDKQQETFYKQHLEQYTTKEVIQNEELKNIKIPKDYEMYINTSRGHYIQFLIQDDTKKKPSKYLTIAYNNSTNNIEKVTEYDVRS